MALPLRACSFLAQTASSASLFNPGTRTQPHLQGVPGYLLDNTSVLLKMRKDGARPQRNYQCPELVKLIALRAPRWLPWLVSLTPCLLASLHPLFGCCVGPHSSPPSTTITAWLLDKASAWPETVWPLAPLAGLARPGKPYPGFRLSTGTWALLLETSKQ